MLIAAVVGVVILFACIAYVVYRKLCVTRQRIEFGAPQDSVAAIFLDIQEDTVRSLHIQYADGSVSEVRTLRAA